jgi:hypothetical protein
MGIGNCILSENVNSDWPDIDLVEKRFHIVVEYDIRLSVPSAFRLLLF